MDPNPLLRIFSNDVFEYFGELTSIFEDTAFRVTGPNKFQGRLEPEPVFFDALVPKDISGHNCGIGMERQPRDPCRGACCLSKEIYKDPFLRHSVLVSEDANRSLVLQHFQSDSR